MSEQYALDRPDEMSAALAAVVDTACVALEDRVALFALLHQVQLRINRALRQAKKDGLVEEIVRVHPEGIGPVSVTWAAIDVRWPVNDPDNWSDDMLQDELATYAAIAPAYIRHVPDHYEIATAELGQGMVDADPVARQLHREAKARRWRTEAGRSATLKVREARP